LRYHFALQSEPWAKEFAMKIIRASQMGMCFGVRDALRATHTVTDPAQVTIHGELVHNSEVSAVLAGRGFRQSAENDRQRLPETPLVLITAHGISEVERHRLKAANKQLIDTTCPLVRRAHDAASKLQADGRHVLVIGKCGHVEVQGIVEDLQSYDVIGSADEVKHYESQRLGIVCQTTVAPDVADAIYARIRLLNPQADIHIVETICEPTRLRQSAMLDLLTRVDAVVVVGGRNSNNTRQLVRLCEENSVRALHVERAGQLDPAWFADVQTVGLTAGTSTPDTTIDEVHEALARIDTSRSKGKVHANEVDAASHARRPAT
jgi:4-hydroxy-3-methylbut-2-enyl diphosphate reductase